MSFEVLVNGAGDAFSRQDYGTNFLLRDDDYLLGIDCPDAYRRAMAEHGFRDGDEPLDVDALDGLLITHLHGDHVNGLEMTLAYRRHVVGDKLDLYTSPQVAETIWDERLVAALGQVWNGEAFESKDPEDYYRLHVVPWEEPTSIGPFELETRETIHHLPATAMRVSDGDATVGYSSDTRFEPDLIDWLSAGAQLLFHETGFGPGHTKLSELVELDDERLGQLRVVHVPESVDRDEVARESSLQFAREGTIYEVTSSGFAEHAAE